MTRVDYKVDPDVLWRLMNKQKIKPRNLIQTLHVKPRTFGEWICGTASPDPRTLHDLSVILDCIAADLLDKNPQQ